MKKLITLIILLTAVGFSQTFDRAYSKGYGISWADSLFSADTTGGGVVYFLPDAPKDTVYSDTAKIYKIARTLEWYEVTIVDTGSADTLQISLGQIRKTQGGVAIDTLWNVAKIKDSSWTLLNQPLIGGGQKTFIIYDPLLPSADLLKIEYVNVAWINGRETALYHRAIKVH